MCEKYWMTLILIFIIICIFIGSNFYPKITNEDIDHKLTKNEDYDQDQDQYKLDTNIYININNKDFSMITDKYDVRSLFVRDSMICIGNMKDFASNNKTKNIHFNDSSINEHDVYFENMDHMLDYLGN